MPSHVTHTIFAEKVYTSAFGVTNISPWLRLGAQGPDLFFHGVRLQPSAQEWGFQIHSEGYGRITAAMAESLLARGGGEDASAYFFGFITHAILDRHIHPLINYTSGWVNPDDTATMRFRFCHAFLERIIDMIFLRNLRGLTIADYRFSTHIPPEEDRQALQVPLLLESIQAAFPQSRADSNLEQKIINTVRDDAAFMAILDTSNKEDRRKAAEAEGRGELPKRCLGLFYPDEIPPGDFLNENHKGWTDPRRGGEERRESFMELFIKAESNAVSLLRLAKNVLSGGTSPDELGEAVGNGDLSDKGPEGKNLLFKYSDPLNLSPFIDKMYAEIGLS